MDTLTVAFRARLKTMRDVAPVLGRNDVTLHDWLLIVRSTRIGVSRRVLLPARSKRRSGTCTGHRVRPNRRGWSPTRSRPRNDRPERSSSGWWPVGPRIRALPRDGRVGAQPESSCDPGDRRRWARSRRVTRSIVMSAGRVSTVTSFETDERLFDASAVQIVIRYVPSGADRAVGLPAVPRVASRLAATVPSGPPDRRRRR